MVEWLTEDEKWSWREFVEGTVRFRWALGRAHEKESPLSLGEYEVMVRLSEQPDRSLRMAALAEELALSRSRVTHTVDRMEKRGLVARESVSGDGRGVRCVMTDLGWDLLVEAAPLHVAAVRRLMVDVLEPGEFAALGRAMAKVNDAARSAGQEGPPPAG